MKKFGWYLLLLAFVEGAAVMVCELLGAKLVSPYFGSSLYVWASALGVTLGALMIGYYLGGVVSSKKKSYFIYIALMVAGLLTVLMPTTAHWIMPIFIDSSVQTGTVVSLLVFMFPQLVLFGMTSPLIINTLNENKDSAGKKAGSVYAISTAGGILATFLMGFYLMPEFGLNMPAAIFGILLIVLAVIGLLIDKKMIAGIASVVVVLIAVLNISSGANEGNSKYRVRYHSDGILGQVKVIDQQFPTYTRGTQAGRVLYVNNTAQSISNRNDLKYSLWDWSYYFPSAASVYPKGSDALLLGLGGGTLVNQFDRLGHNLEVVELDERIKDVTLEYFGVDPSTNIIVDDGRHFINVTDHTYDVITMDVFFSETPPSQLISVESFSQMKKLLNKDGMVMMNFYGYLTGDMGKAGRSVYKTFQEAGFDTKLFVSPGNEGGRNLILLACTGEKDFTNIQYEEPGLPALGDITKYFIDPSTLDLDDAVVLTDDVPVLEKMYIDCALEWRSATNGISTKTFIKEGIQ